MKPTYRIVISLGLLAGLLLSAAGCQEAESDAALVRRARLVANENITLKKQLDEKDQQIARLEQQIEKLEQEKHKITKDTGEATLRMLQITAEAEQRATFLREENERLKQKLQELQSP